MSQRELLVSGRRGHVRVRFPQGVLRGGPEPGDPLSWTPRAFWGKEMRGSGHGRAGGDGFRSQRSAPRLFPRQRVLLFVASDVDALCACKILQVSPADWEGGARVRGEGAGWAWAAGRGAGRAESGAGSGGLESRGNAVGEAAGREMRSGVREPHPGESSGGVGAGAMATESWQGGL